MKAATLFSGIGAPEVAMPLWQWLWHAEIEPFPCAVMAARHPASRNLGDVSAPLFADYAMATGQPDVAVFGSPCQDFSIAGLRAGMDGERGGLAGIAVEAVARIGAKWVVFENVPGMLSSFSGAADAESHVRAGHDVAAEGDEDSDFAAFLRAFRQWGYLGCWRVFDAQYAGVPQRRRRVFFVGYLGDWRPAVAVLFEPESLRRNHPPSREAGKRVAPTVEARAGAGGAAWGTDFLAGGGLAAASEISGAVSRKWSKGTGGPAGDECYNLVGFSCKDDGQGSATNLSPTLRAMDFDGSHANGGGQMAVAFQTRIARNGRGQPEDIAPALNGADAGATSDMRPCVAITGEKQNADAEETDAAEALRALLDEVGEEAFSQWCAGIIAAFWPQEVLRARVHGCGFRCPSEPERGLVNYALACSKGMSTGTMPPLWNAGCDGRPPRRWRPHQQLIRKLEAYLPQLPYAPSPAERFMRALRPAAERSRLLQQTLYSLQEARESECAQGAVGDCAVRRLIVDESEALQGLPRGYTNIKFRGKPAADGPRYMAIGNSMAVPDIRWILQRIERFERWRATCAA